MRHNVGDRSAVCPGAMDFHSCYILAVTML